MKNRKILLALLMAFCMIGAAALEFAFRQAGSDGNQDDLPQAEWTDGEEKTAYAVALRLGFMPEETKDGLYVIGVSQDSFAEKHGIMAGDRILGLNGSALSSAEELDDRLNDAGLHREGLTLTVLRNGKEIDLVLQKTKNPD